MIVAAAALAALNVFLLIWALWILSNIRDDQLVIRAFIAKLVRESRAVIGAPTDDEGFAKWLKDNR